MGKGADLAFGAADSAIGMGMGLLLGDINDKRQLKQNERLGEQNWKFQKRAAEFNMQQQLEMWKATNYSAQMEEMRKAGLNPALAYGMKGGGGVTTGSSNASAPQGGVAPVGGGEAMGMMQQRIQMRLLEAQARNIEADTKNKESQNSNIEQDTIGKGIANEISQMEFELGQETYDARKYAIKTETNKRLQELQLLQNQGIVAENTTMDRIAIVGAELIGLELRNELTKAQTGKTWSDIEVNKAQIQNWLVQNAQGWSKLSLDERNTKVQELLGEFNTSLSREALGAIGGIVSTILSRGLSKGVKKTNIVINKTGGE